MKKLTALSLGILSLCVMISPAAKANPADYVYTPAVEYGEREFDIKFGTNTDQPGVGTSGGASLGYGYGATEYWFTEIYLKQERSGSKDTNLAEWENKFQFTDTGKYFLDVGMITELEAPLSANTPWAFKFGPLLQKELGKFQLNGNLLFERPFGASDNHGQGYDTDLSYQFQAKYRWQQALEIGAQAFGDMGKWNDWNNRSAQDRRFGPAAFGKFPFGNRKALRYNVAWLFGTSDAAPNHTFRMQVEYEY